MKMRLYRNSDYTVLSELLETEGFMTNALKCKNSETYLVVENKKVCGFFTLSVHKNLVALKHFVVDRNLRHIREPGKFLNIYAASMVNWLDTLLRERDTKFFLISVNDQPGVEKVMRRYYINRLFGLPKDLNGDNIYLVGAPG